jgi:alkylhydroperoxidase family enzyme
MPRLRQVPRAEAPANVLKYYDRLFGARDPVAEPGTATGTPGDWWTVFALVPAVFDHATAHFGMFGMFADQSVSKLDPQLRELGILRAGYVAGSQFVFSQHCKAMRTHGFTEEQVQAIPFGAGAPCWSPIEAAVLAYTDCLVYDGGRVPDSVFAALKAELSDEQILYLTYITALYDMHAVMSKALRTEYDNRDEPIVEIGGGLLKVADSERDD